MKFEGKSLRKLVGLPLPIPKLFKKQSQTSSSVMEEAINLDVCLIRLSAFVFLYMNSGGGYWHCSLEDYAGTFLTIALDRDTSKLLYSGE